MVQPRPTDLEAADRYLSTLGVSLWGDWEIQNPERRKLAARWLATQMRAVQPFVDQVLAETFDQ